MKKGPKDVWQEATPETIPGFSALLFSFGFPLQKEVDVPIGLMVGAVGGTPSGFWLSEEMFRSDEACAEVVKTYAASKEYEVAVTKHKESMAKWEQEQAAWKVLTDAAKKEGKTPPPAPRPLKPLAQPGEAGNGKIGQLFEAHIRPYVGYGIKGVIWYQGESNAGRAYEHAELFPFLIEQWRKEQGQGDFSFYWVQLADYMAEKPTPGESAWAELRETQTKTLGRVPNTGQAVIIDIGEGRDIHPRNKYDVASRLVRWALVKDYGLKFPYRSPEYKSVAIAEGKATVTLDCFGSTLRAFDVTDARGFAICGEDKVWKWASAKIVGNDKVEVSHPEIPAPIAVRYAWADNPVCNLFSADGLPVTPFRTDDFEMTTKPKPPAPKPAPAAVP
jgi:sialate O-acetylesterase